MKTEYFATDFVSNYTNNGQALEQEYRYFKTGLIIKADNLKASDGCDFDTYSIKSARATICKGLDIDKHLATDKAKSFIYLAKNKIAYIMSRQEYKEFVNLFATKDVESGKNGKSEKLRLGRETSKMMAWLEGRA